MLTKRMQIDTLATMLQGMDAPAGTRVVDFDEPWRTVYQAIKSQPISEARVKAMNEAMTGHAERESVVSTLLSSSQIRNSAAYRSLLEIAPELLPIEWLWKDWIARGMLSMLAAVPGAGKSFVALDLCRRIITPNEPWPDGTRIMHHGKVIYIDAEAVPQILNERADAWSLDKSKIYLMMPDTAEMIDFGEQVWRDRLIEMTYTLRPELIIIDSLGSISTRGENNVEDVRELMGWLSRLAVDFNIGLMMIHHLRKRGSLAIMDLVSQDDVRGSGHIVAAVRTLLGLSIIKDSDQPDRNGPRRLEVIKTNLSRYPKPLGIEFMAGHPSGVVLQYGEAPEMHKEESELERCTQWLLDLLAGGPMSPKEVVDNGKDSGFSQASVYRARQVLGKKIHNTAGRQSKNNLWELIG